MTSDQHRSDNRLRRRSLNPLKHTRLIEAAFESTYGGSLDAVTPQTLARAYSQYIRVPGSVEDQMNRVWSAQITTAVASLSVEPNKQAAVAVLVPTRGLALEAYIRGEV